jgi:hypothetical protein
MPNEQLYYDSLRAILAADKQVRYFDAPGREFFYLAGQLLVAKRDLARVQARLAQLGYQFRRGEDVAGIARLLLSVDADIPGIVTTLRDVRQWKFEERVPAVQPHHVIIGSGNIMGSPWGSPVPAAALPDPVPPKDRPPDGTGVLVGICDTGISQDAAVRHPLWIGNSYVPQADDVDPLYVHEKVLALEGGHGTFIAGVLRQAALGASFDPEVALSANGIGTEETLANALAGLDPGVHIVNLSLGCFTQDNLASLPMAAALAALPAQAAVVAAAGNAGQNRPFWPAALDQVIAVGGVTRTSSGVIPADYSNYGAWVDACADGDRVSTYVDGSLELSGVPPVAFSGFARWVGTSFAAPYVAGRLATLMTTNGMTAAEARISLLSAARWDPDYGVLVS